VIGTLNLAHERVEPFTERQIDLVRTFADQAVIAIENARLIAETREALEQQTATAEVLGVINASPGDLKPVFEAMLEKATRLCEGSQGVLWTIEDGSVRSAATFGVTPEYAAFLRRGATPGPTTPFARIMRGERIVEVLDLAEDEGYRAGDPVPRAAVEIGGFRSMIFVALLRDETLLGAFAIARREVRPFTDRQIALLQNFAAQAVIAMENARLMTETREALEQQTATAEVLSVINASPGDLTPVFDAILEKANYLCETVFGVLWTFDGTHFFPGAIHGPQAFIDAIKDKPRAPTGGGTLYRHAAGEQLVHIEDMAAETGVYETNSTRRVFVDLGGGRSALSVALSKDDRLLGAIQVYRQEVRPFTDKQVALLQNFAAQAVIAMENARLLTETREALEQQTATTEVLQVINSSPGDLTPVFDDILSKATRLCDAEFGVFWSYDGKHARAAALKNVPRAFAEAIAAPFQPLGDGPFARLIAGDPVAQVLDPANSQRGRAEVSPLRRAYLELGGPRTVLFVALRKEDALLGALMLYRPVVRGFSEKQVAVVANFAAQAVIAIENARLITETREALEQQTATAGVLQVINSSPGELAPVFEAMVEKAMRLCEAACGHLWRFDGRLISSASVYGEPRIVEHMRQVGPMIPPPGSAVDRLVRGERFVHMIDPTQENAYRDSTLYRSFIDAAGVRTSLAVPLRKDDVLLGAIVVYRQEVRAFTDKQIALLENFAAQAVVAMENARLMTETREALEQQTATAEVLQVINSSPGDLAPVFDAILQKAHTLCGAAHGALGTYDGDYYFRSLAERGYPEPLAERLREGFPGLTNPVTRPLIDGARFVHIPDLAEIDHPIPQAVAKLGGFHTGVFLPLRKDGRLLGHISATRAEVQPFTEKEIALLENFAAQAVIAMENARLMTETREALERQTATAEVLQVINSSPGDLAPVFDAMLEKATMLCDAHSGFLWTYDGERYRGAATRGLPRSFDEFVRDPRVPGPDTGIARLAAGEALVHFTDLAATGPYQSGDALHRASVDLGGFRTILAVPLRKDDVLLGGFTIDRQEVRPFSERQIALLQNFAAQAVIAMENARLLTETREALEQQTATAEILQVISSSPGNLVAVFGAILEQAHRLCGVTNGAVGTYDGEQLRAVATHGITEPLAGVLRQPFRPMPNSPHARMIREVAVIHIPDVAAEAQWERDDPKRIGTVEQGIRTMLFVPLRKDNVLLGYFTANRLEARPFSDKEVALLESFAAQAVIAMENARLLGELRERTGDLQESLEYQTATSDVLKVISRSAFDLQPVLDTLVETAARLCTADQAVIFRRQGELYALSANFGFPAEYEAYWDSVGAVPADPGSPFVGFRCIHEARPVHVHDVAAIPGYPEVATTQGKARTVLGVPLLREGEAIGNIVLARQRVEPFTDRQIELVRTFADQAVIAIENARLITETREARDGAEHALRDLKAAQANLIQAEKMASLGQLTAGIAHEIKNPLNFVNNFAGLSVELLDELRETAGPALAALDEDKRDEFDETVAMLSGNLQKIGEHGRRADNIVKSMLEHSRGVSGERREVDVNGLIDEALNLAYHGARAQDQGFNITLERDYAATFPQIELAPQEMTRVFLNLFGNGFYAANKRARDNGDRSFRPVLSVATRDLGEAVEVKVRDNGTGIPPEIRDKLFQPFFTTKPTGEGTGLGLSISYDIVTQQHGGSIEVESRVGEFTEFTVRLPRHP